MPKIKITNGIKLIKLLEKNGFKKIRQNGSHVVLINKQKKLLTVVPVHGNKNLGIGLISSILKQSDIDIDFYNNNIK